jgi:hypothetical protein
MLNMRLLGRSGVSQYLQDRAKRESQINEIKEILLDESETKLSRYKKFGLESKNGYLRLLMDLGNQAFYSGDTEVSRLFLQVILELKAAGVLDEDIFLGRIQHFGLRSIDRLDYDFFALTLDGFVEHIYGLNENSSVYICLQVLEKLSHGAVSKDNEACIAKLINVFALLSVHFENQSMLVSKMEIGNFVISLVNFAERTRGESLRNRIIAAITQLPNNGKKYGALLSTG